ncbi:DUF6483 family protein [Proteiniborus sp.]|uniref:DUF6483 family protein n=1 Tax=Proteiniborus sp. TaxID=2079015 RepID=UPI0033265DC5
MFYQKDWVMKQIQSMIQLIARYFFKKDIIKYEIIDETNITQTDLLHKELVGLLNSLRINEAENLLFERIVADDLNHLAVALDFYRRISELSDEELEEANFSREEIKNGLEEISKMYGLTL